MRRIIAALALLTGCTSTPVFTHSGTHGDHGTVAIVPGELAVVWRDDATAEQIADAEHRAGMQVETGWSDRAFAIATHVGVAETLLAKLRGDPLVAAAEPVYEYDALFVPNDPEFARQWHMQQIGAESAWDWGTGANVIVAVIDTGVSSLTDLPADRLVPGYDFVNGHAAVTDDQGHGSHVAGTIAQSTNNGAGVAGLAHSARIMPIKVLDAHGHGDTAHIAEGIRWAVDHGAKVLNLSLGGGGYSEAMASAVHYAHRNGVVVVCAAGNGFGPPVNYPAAYDDAIAVSAVRFDRALAPYSSFGPEVTLAAPGGDKSVDQNHDGFPDGVLQQTVTGFEWFQGTSMATPHVAAAAALLAGAGVTRADAIQSILESTATQLGDREKFGAGEINAASALRHVRLFGGLWRFATALLLAFAARRLVLRRDGRAGSLGLLGLVGLAIAACGLIVLPLVGLGHSAAGQLLSTPLPEWGQMINGSVTSSPVVLSAFAPFLILRLARMQPMQGIVAGLILGYAAYLAHAAIVGWVDLSWIPGRAIEAVWLAGNAFVAFVLGMVALRVQR